MDMYEIFLIADTKINEHYLAIIIFSTTNNNCSCVIIMEKSLTVCFQVDKYYQEHLMCVY